tara:strand:+ start:1396 stop:1566 length:171 start_codon:yes stop_codon:yes gene_type:complete
MEDDQQGLLIPLEIIILGFASHLSNGYSFESIEDEAIYNLHTALELEMEKRGAVLH